MPSVLKTIFRRSVVRLYLMMPAFILVGVIVSTFPVNAGETLTGIWVDSTGSRGDSSLTVPNRDNGARFYKSLEEQGEKSWWRRELLGLLLEPQARKPVRIENSKKPFEADSGKVIHTIQYRRLEVFGPSFLEINQRPDSWLERTGNHLHSLSRKTTIDNQVFIHPGETVDPSRLAENERYLRNLPFIEDARLILVPVNNDSHAVDLVIVTKDVWSVGVDLAMRDVNNIRTTVFDRNLIGYGHNVSTRWLYSTKKRRLKEQEYSYKIRNISGSFIDGSLGYFRNGDGEIYNLQVNRPFLADILKLSGGVNLTETHRFPNEQEEPSLQGFRLHTYDFWLGTSQSLPRKRRFPNSRRNRVVSMRILRNIYANRPPEAYQYFHQSTLYLMNLMILRRSLYRGTYIYALGRTEDIPFGSIVSLTGGYEEGEFNDRLYGGIEVADGYYKPHFGYFFSSARLGGFTSSLNPDQAILNIRIRYFTPLIKLESTFIRQFLKADFTDGYTINDWQRIRLDDRNGVRGLAGGAELEGKSRFWVNYESVFYPPWNLYGFRFAPYLFFDAGVINSVHKNLLRKPFYSGIGAGVRVRNERLVFKTIHLRLAYYPRNTPEMSQFQWDFSGEPTPVTESFEGRPPEVFSFR